MLQKDTPDHHDAELVIRLYELRREPVMRESRAMIISKYWPASAEEATEVIKAEHPMNAAYRQVASYWEMVFGMAHAGIVHADYLVEHNGEGLFLFARVQPYLDAIRAAHTPRAFRHAEWAGTETEAGRRLVEEFRGRIARRTAARAS
jgi:5'(3')-deoxyribonucleotidase